MNGRILVDKNLLTTLLNLASVVEARDAYTGGHIWRVSQYARMLAEKIGLDRDGILISQLGGMVHDIGKIGIPDSILCKDGPLTDLEFEKMKTHTEIGKNLIESHPLAPIIMDSVFSHHERLDGHGYPQALSEVMLLGRIISIADAFDAMTSTRPYRQALSVDKALSIVEENLGSQFDPALGKQFLQIGKTTKFDHIVGHFNEGKELLYCPKCGPTMTYNSEFKSGSRIACNSCHYEFIAHQHGETFELEGAGRHNLTNNQSGDIDIIKTFSQQMAESIKIAL